MPWNAHPFAGFSSVSPWLPLNPDWPERNVEQQMGDAQSMLILHRRLLALRRTSDALAIGDFALADAEGDIHAYERRHGDARVFVALNLGSDAQRASLPGWAACGRVMLPTLPAHPAYSHSAVMMRANEVEVMAAP